MNLPSVHAYNAECDQCGKMRHTLYAIGAREPGSNEWYTVTAICYFCIKQNERGYYEMRREDDELY